MKPCAHRRLRWSVTRWRVLPEGPWEENRTALAIVCEDCGAAWQEHLAARRGLVPQGPRP